MNSSPQQQGSTQINVTRQPTMAPSPSFSSRMYAFFVNSMETNVPIIFVGMVIQYIDIGTDIAVLNNWREDEEWVWFTTGICLLLFSHSCGIFAAYYVSDGNKIVASIAACFLIPIFNMWEAITGNAYSTGPKFADAWSDAARSTSHSTDVVEEVMQNLNFIEIFQMLQMPETKFFKVDAAVLRKDIFEYSLKNDNVKMFRWFDKNALRHARPSPELKKFFSKYLDFDILQNGHDGNPGGAWLITRVNDMDLSPKNDDSDYNIQLKNQFDLYLSQDFSEDLKVYYMPAGHGLLPPSWKHDNISDGPLAYNHFLSRIPNRILEMKYQIFHYPGDPGHEIPFHPRLPWFIHCRNLERRLEKFVQQVPIDQEKDQRIKNRVVMTAFALQKMIEALFEAVPQSILQAYVLMRQDDYTALEVASIAASAISIAIAAVKATNVLFENLVPFPISDVIYISLVFIFYMSDCIMRILAIGLSLWAFRQWYFFILCFQVICECFDFTLFQTIYHFPLGSDYIRMFKGTYWQEFKGVERRRSIYNPDDLLYLIRCKSIHINTYLYTSGCFAPFWILIGFGFIFVVCIFTGPYILLTICATSIPFMIGEHVFIGEESDSEDCDWQEETWKFAVVHLAYPLYIVIVIFIAFAEKLFCPFLVGLYMVLMDTDAHTRLQAHVNMIQLSEKSSRDQVEKFYRNIMCFGEPYMVYMRAMQSIFFLCMSRLVENLLLIVFALHFYTWREEDLKLVGEKENFEYFGLDSKQLVYAYTLFFACVYVISISILSLKSNNIIRQYLERTPNWNEYYPWIKKAYSDLVDKGEVRKLINEVTLSGELSN